MTRAVPGIHGMRRRVSASDSSIMSPYPFSQLDIA